MIALAMVGTIFQWFDFSLFSYYTPVFAKFFFQQDNPTTAMLNTLLVFAMSYLLSPLGSVIFGYIGDKKGRKQALVISILCMAIPTTFIGCLPTYASIGIAAPVLLMMIRVIQGLVASAEYSQSAIYMIEHAPPQKQAFMGTLTSTSYCIGVILAGLAATFLPHWRLGFILAGLFGLYFYFMRKTLPETPGFLAISTNKNNKFPFIEVLRSHPQVFIRGVMIGAWVGVYSFLTHVYMISYLSTKGFLPFNWVTGLVTMGMLVDAVFQPIFARIADRVGHMNMLRAGQLAMLLGIFPLVYAVMSGHTLGIIMGIIGLACLMAMTFSTINAYLVNLFPIEYRSSGVNISFHIGLSLFGATAPYVVYKLVDFTQMKMFLAIYLFCFTLIGCLATKAFIGRS